ncbi:isocitrate lyase/PEP mutase family protein [Cupriavidus basilensis]|jgi:2-methylisocitrate lyase-like PEP mutase family enzyme|uniref:isocitrate lyase/PEP mutase family protein n=1 Tax=unclassified Cupriavidus TaxID=2640874 RepID=UPI00044A2047|nr:oxaloacetate decarboxylase [Cupriavidus sp. SK-3]KDP83331.1 carboxyvinyl-carboxyphosphonate phosphorylmutase [Cupriavidus sp. SK-3]
MTTPLLEHRLREPRVLLAPGVYDAFSALLAAQAGFEALYLSGAAVAYTQLGRSDVGLTTATETADIVGRITDRVGVPLIVDADTGYGNALNVIRTVRSLERAGAAMIQIEDQTFPKRCGHLDNKRVVSTAEMCGKLKAALDSRASPRTLILARTDAVAIEGLDAAIERAEAYVECGVDALFIEALRTEEDMALVCERFAGRIPLLANMVEGGKTPVQSAAALGNRGFRIVIFPGGVVRFLGAQMKHYYSTLLEHGTTAPMRDAMLDFDGLNAVIGTPELIARGQRYGE